MDRKNIRYNVTDVSVHGGCLTTNWRGGDYASANADFDAKKDNPQTVYVQLVVNGAIVRQYVRLSAPPGACEMVSA